jgi:hypothetical protein
MYILTYIPRRGNTSFANLGQHLWTTCIYRIYLLGGATPRLRSVGNTLLFFPQRGRGRKRWTCFTVIILGWEMHDMAYVVWGYPHHQLSCIWNITCYMWAPIYFANGRTSCFSISWSCWRCEQASTSPTYAIHAARPNRWAALHFAVRVWWLALALQAEQGLPQVLP